MKDRVATDGRGCRTGVRRVPIFSLIRSNAPRCDATSNRSSSIAPCTTIPALLAYTDMRTWSFLCPRSRHLQWDQCGARVSASSCPKIAMRLPLAVQSQVSSPAWSHLRPGILQRSMTSNTFDRQWWATACCGVRTEGDKDRARRLSYLGVRNREPAAGGRSTPTDHVLPLQPTLNVMSEM